MITKIADLVKDKVLTEISDLAGPLRPDRDADPDRAQARRDPAGRPQQALQAHAAADDVRLQRRRARRRRAADAVAARARSRSTSTTSARSSRAARSTSCARPRSARTSSQGYLIALDNLDEVIALIRGVGRHRRGAHGPDGAASSSPRSRPRRSSTSASRADRARAQARSRTSTTTSRSGSPSCARSSATRPASTPSSARSCSRSRRSTAGSDDRRTEIVGRRGGARARGPDRRGGHGHRDHALGLHQAAAGRPPTASSAAAASASWAWS